MSDDSRELSRMEDILSGEDYLPKKPMSRVEELLLDGAMVPKVDSTDNGKVLKVIDGEWKPGEDVSGDNLPPVSSLDNGKVLKVVNGEWNIGSDKSDIVMVQMGVSYASFKNSNQVTLPTNIKDVLLANYYSNPPVPTYLITSDSVIFEPIEVNKSVGTTPLVQIRWGRFHSEFDSVTRESNVYNDSIIYNTQDNDTVARFTKSKALQTIPPVDVTDNGKVMQVDGGHWTASELPTYAEVPAVSMNDVGKVLKATGYNTYDWRADNTDIIVFKTLDEYPFDNDEVALTGINEILLTKYNRDLPNCTPVYIMTSNGMIFEPVTNHNLYIDPNDGLTGSISWSRIIDINGKLIRENINYTVSNDEEGTFASADLQAGGGVAVPPVIFDDDKLKTMTIDDFPGITKVYLTAQEYAALSTAEKQDLSKIYYISDYEFYSSDDGKVVIRFNDDGTEKLIFFNGFVDNFDTVTPYSNFPEELRTIVTNNAIWGSAATILSTNYDSEGVVRSGNEAFFGIRTTQDWHVNSCNSSGGSYAAKNKANYAILDMLSNTQYQLSPSWSDPYDIPYGYDAIYYGGKEYEDFNIPKELPYVTSSDAGKVLQVNSQGIWTEGNVPRTNAVQVPPVLYDNNNLFKMTVDNFPGLEKIYLTAEEYTALTTTQKQDLSKIYYVSPYKYYDVFEDGKVIIRTYGTTYEWFFNGMILTDQDPTLFIPNQYVQYTKNTPYQGSTAWSDTSSTTSLGIIEMGVNGYTDRISAQAGTWSGQTIKNTPIYGVVVIGNGGMQTNVYSDPYDTPNPIEIFYGGKQYTNFDIPNPLPSVTSSDEGKILQVNASGEWDKEELNAITPIRLSKAAYDALTPAQKTDTSKLYLIDGSIITDETLISPDDLSADDGKVISSGANSSNYPDWKLFSGSKSTSPYSNTFMPAYNTQTCYAGYHFTDKPHKITKVKYRVIWSGNAGTITNSVYVEGSNDGTNWIDIGGGAVAMSIEENGYSDYEVPCDMNEYSYIRIRFANPVNVTGSNKFFTMSYLEIYATETAKVYNAICYNNAEYASLDPIHYYREISQYDYDQLPDTKNSDGIIYFITDNS